MSETFQQIIILRGSQTASWTNYNSAPIPNNLRADYMQIFNWLLHAIFLQFGEVFASWVNAHTDVEYCNITKYKLMTSYLE